MKKERIRLWQLNYISFFPWLSKLVLKPGSKPFGLLGLIPKDQKKMLIIRAQVTKAQTGFQWESAHPLPTRSSRTTLKFHC